METIPTDCAVMFSGGVDCGVLAAIAKKYSTPPLYTVGLEGSHDLISGKSGAEEIGLPWFGITLTKDDIIEACVKTLEIVDMSPLELSFELPLQMVASRVKECNLISGQGADELFGGYKRYSEMSLSEADSALRSDYEKLSSTTILKENLIAKHYNKTLHRPYMDRRVADIALHIPISEKISNGTNKMPLRRVAADLNLASISLKNKKAAQYGSGIMKCLKTEAKKEKLRLDEYVESLKKSRNTNAI